MNDDKKSPNPEATAPARALNRPDDHVYNELTRTNNELANLHREVARQNAELAAAQKKLQASEQRYRSLSACSPIGILEMDVAGRCLCCNPHWQTITGLSVDESLGDGWQDVMDPRDASAFLEEWNMALDAGLEFNRELRFVTTCGDARWAQVRSRVILDPQGQIAGRVSTVEDITERKQAETALRASEAEFRALAEAMPQMVWMTRPDGWCIYLSQQWMDYTGQALKEGLGQGWNQTFHPEDQQRTSDAWQLAVTTGRTYSIESRIRRTDGLYRWWLIRSVPQLDAAGNILKWFGTCTDIHDLKMAELEISRTNRELQRQQAKMRVLFDLIPAMIWFKDTENRILRVNQRVADAAGKTVTEIEGKPSHEIYPHDAARFYADDLAVMRSRAPKLGYVETVLNPDGEDLWVQTDKVPYYDKDGAVIGIVVMAQDITERKHAEAEMEKIHRELLNASHQAGMAEVATSVLHNVGNVLNSVNVTSTMLAERLRKSKLTSLSKLADLVLHHEGDLAAFLTGHPKGRQLPGFLAKLAAHLSAEREFALGELAQLQDHIEHIKNIVNMQQGFAKVSGVTEKLMAADLMEDALKLNSSSLVRHDIVIIRDYQDVPPLTVAKHKALQILVNLVRNAKQACAEAVTAEKRLTLRITSDDGRISIAVSDNGVGIAPENLTRIFAHGFTTKAEGHGFGLHAAALAAGEMGGSLTVHSDGPGCGATFTLVLPVE